MRGFHFTETHHDPHSAARLGRITTPHGTIDTPAFVPVGTQATVKSLTPDDLHTLGVELFFVNTYHTYLRPNLDVIKTFGGLHAFMGWHGPIITDSGGFQVFSLARPKYKPLDRDEENATLVNISEDGVTFRSHWDGSEHYFTPETSMQYQWTLGSDIHIAFDECTTYPTTPEYARKAMDRTHRWLVRSIAEHARQAASIPNRPYQALYGAIQGSIYEALRKESAHYICSLDTDGIAIGGVSVGESKEEMRQVLDWVMPVLPAQKPRHLLGVGEIDDIFVLIEHGVDTFDCVQPTRIARMGRVYVLPGEGSQGFDIDITHVQYKQDTKPIDPQCSCYTCTHFSRAYLHHLFRVRELLGYRLASLHNLYYINSLVRAIRRSIADGSFLELKKQWLYNK